MLGCLALICLYVLLLHHASWFGVYIFWELFIFLWLWWFGLLYFGFFIWFFWFYAGLMFFWFSGWFLFLIFWWFFGDFLIFLRFFFEAFALTLLTKKGTFFEILLQFIFFGVYYLALMRWPVTSHRVKFTALRLVLNRICIGVCIYTWKYKKSIKRDALSFQGVHVYRLQYHVTCKTRAFWRRFYTLYLAKWTQRKSFQLDLSFSKCSTTVTLMSKCKSL